MSDFLFIVYAYLHHFSSALEISCVLIFQAQIPASIFLTPSVPDLSCDDKPLLVVIDGLPGIAQGGVGQS